MPPGKSTAATRRHVPIDFSNAALATIRTSLNHHADADRLEKLPLILRGWSQTDLKEHLSGTVPPVLRDRHDKLSRVAQHAVALAEAIAAIDTPGETSQDEQPSPGFSVAIEMAALTTGKSLVEVGQHDIDADIAWLNAERQRLIRLAQAAANVAERWAPKKGRPRAKPQYLVMLDLAAVFEWATQKSAERRVYALDHPDTGKDYGPFWDFVRSVWPVIFESEAGLTSAMKNWARWRNEYGDASALIANMNLRHPEWGLIASP